MIKKTIKEEPNKWRDNLYSWTMNIVLRFQFSQLNLQIQGNSNQILEIYFLDVHKVVLNVYVEAKPRKTNTVRRKTPGGLTLTDFKFY